MATFPTLSEKPTYPIEKRTEDSAIRSPFENGSVLTRARFTRLRATFTLKWNGMDNTDRDTLMAFWDTMKGGSDSFDWTDPYDSTVYLVRFTGEIKQSQIDTEHWEIELEIQEV